MAATAEAAQKSNYPSTVKTLSFQTFDAPIFKANIERLGLLGPSLASDVVMVSSRANSKPATVTLERPIPNDVQQAMYAGNAESLETWAYDLLHVANRLRAEMNNQPDPGTLWDDQQRRKAEKRSKKT